MNLGQVVAVAAFSLAVVGFSGIFGRSNIRSPLQFFHSPDSTLNTISLFVASVTVASGIGYLVSGGQINGLLMLCVPIAMVIGYHLLVVFFSRVVSPELAAYPSFWAGAQAMTTSAIGKESVLRYVLVGPLATIFLLFCAFELLVSAQIIEAIMVGSGTITGQVLVAAAMFISTLVLSWRGGVQSVFRTDRIQFVGILLFAAVFAVAAWISGTGHVSGAASKASTWYKSDFSVLVTVALACLGSVLTQFYSTINHHIASNSSMALGTLRRIMIRASAMMAAFFGLMIAIGIFSGIDWAKGLPAGTAVLLGNFSPGPTTTFVLAVIVVGLVCVTMSTLDSLMIAVTMQIYDGIAKRNSRSETDDALELARIRRYMALTFGVVVVLSAAAFFAKPSVFYTLLAIASGADSLAPLILLIGFLSSTPRRLAVLTNARLWFYVAVFLSAVGSNLALSALHPGMVPYVSLFHLSLATLYSLILWIEAKRRSQPHEREDLSSR